MSATSLNMSKAATKCYFSVSIKQLFIFMINQLIVYEYGCMGSRRKPITNPWTDALSLRQGNTKQHEKVRALKRASWISV